MTTKLGGRWSHYGEYSLCLQEASYVRRLSFYRRVDLGSKGFE